MRTECGNAEVAPSCPACPAPERRTQLHRRAATPRRLACRLPEGGTRANVAMSDVMRNQGLAAPGPLSQPCRCSPRTARGWPVHFPSPSRFWGAIGKTTNGSDVMLHRAPLLVSCSATNLVASGSRPLFHAISQTLPQTTTWRIEIHCAIVALFGPLLVALPTLKPHTGPFRCLISIRRPFSSHRVPKGAKRCPSKARWPGTRREEVLPCVSEASDGLL
jgi:hypothetical protein